MFKTVNFNIFEENLDELVYGQKAAAKLRKELPEAPRDEKQTVTEKTFKNAFWKERADAKTAPAKK